MQSLRDLQKKVADLGYKQFGLADKSGNAIFTDGQRIDISDRDYFQAALKGKTYISSTHVSRLDNSLIFVYATPVYHYATEEVNGALVVLVDVSKFNDQIRAITYGRTGYAFAVDKTGKTIAHRDFERVKNQENILEKAKGDPSLKDLVTVINKMSQGEEGLARYTFQGEDKMVAYAPVKTTGWSIAITAPTQEVMARTSSLKITLITISLVIILAAVGITFFVARNISQPLVDITGILGVVAQGDFTQEVPEKYLNSRDETGKLAQAVKAIQEKLRPLLNGLKMDAQTLAGSSENLSAISQEIASSSGEVAKAIQQVASGATEQAGHLEEILTLMENISQALEKVAQQVDRVKTASEHSSKMAEAGKGQLDGLISSIRESSQAFKAVAERLNLLKGSVAQAAEILEVINGIAEQTNLLALNAAIEAARAGEAGRGFAVVAEEVRKLAEESRSSADKIRSLLSNITRETEQVVSTSEETNKQVSLQLEKVDETFKAFRDIIEAVKNMRPAIEGTYKELGNTVKAKDVVLDKVQSISAVSEETSASAEEISASAEELSASTQEIAANSQQLLTLAKRLDNRLNRFKV